MSVVQPGPKRPSEGDQPGRATAERLSAHPELLQALTEHAPDHVYLKDAGGRYRHVNRALASFYGLGDPRDVLGKSDFDYYPPEDARRFRQDEREIMATGRPLVDRIERCVRADGDVRWFTTTKVPIHDDAGQVTGLFGISRDVTARHRGEALLALECRLIEALGNTASLHEALGTIASAIETQSEGMLCSVLLLDETGRCLRHGAAPSLPREYVDAIEGVPIGPDVGACGTAAYHCARVVTEDVLTDHRWEGYRELAARHGLRACWSQPILLRYGEVLGTFAMYYRKPRRPHVFERRLIDMATRISALAIMLDREQQARRVAHENERRFRDLAETIDAVFWLTDGRARRVIYVSPAVERVWGRSVESVLTNPDQWLESIHPDDRARTHDRFERIIEEGKFEEEYRIVRPDGSTRWIRDRGYLIGDSEHGVRRVAGIATDITRQKRAEEDAEHLHQELAWATRQATLGELAASLAHELNQPLTAIVNFLTCSANEIASGDGFDRDTVLADIRESTTQVRRASEIMRGLRRLASDRVPHREDVDLNGLVRDVVRLIEPVARSKRITIRLELADAVPALHASGVQIQQVVMNLGMNAIAAMEETGRERVLLIETSTGGARTVELSVQDNGKGIDATVMATIFENFVTTKPGGLGFGLPIARRIAKAHGGSLSWEPASPTGTRFTLSLPVGGTGYRGDEPSDRVRRR